MVFYLESTELAQPYSPRQCRILKRISSNLRDDLAVIEVIPPIPYNVYNTNNELSTLIIGTRFEQTTIFPVTEWPLYVYICVLREYPNTIPDMIDANSLIILDWGVIYQAKEPVK